ncbi:hypothetical protein [Moraxella sp. VT-16-12]|uniref:hypothetical protein n=1 Tax=Moraxella sp. VT-16-12 TaxID=2014877 RepID=UPI000B7FD170|nr:hypothetical protein [Moraxella sp. VT-16-12]TWV80817.1 hypothetical protein CEW93_009460 [Moraxella sp. VT-16-12]
MPYKEHIKWLEEDHQRLDELAFMQALNLCDISVYQDGGIELGCDGQALFGGHGVLAKIKQGDVIDVCIN